MFCIKCNRHIAYCKCEDIDQRLAEIGKSEIVKDLALGAMEQRVEQKVNKNIDPNIELLLDNYGKRARVLFRSNKYDGIYYLTGKVMEVTPEYIWFHTEDTNYPGGKFDCLNTSRMLSAEIVQEAENNDKG